MNYKQNKQLMENGKTNEITEAIIELAVPVETQEAIVENEVKIEAAMEEYLEAIREEKVYEMDFKDFDINKVINETVVEFVSKKEDTIKDSMNAYMDKNLKEIASEVARKLRPIVIKLENQKEIKLEGRVHKEFKNCLFLCQQERQLFIAGPAGSGKTTLASQIAKALDLNFKHISCSAGMSEAHLLGRMLFDGTYVKSDLVECYENGGVFLFDEIDAADANTLLIINSALANGVLSVPNRKENNHALRHKDFICVCAGNTWGNGSFEYQGRNHLDAAFLDRFSISKVLVDYDKELEQDICGEHKEVFTTFQKVRENVTKARIRRVVSTRCFIAGTRQKLAGKYMKEILNTFFVGWSPEEINKAMIDVQSKPKGDGVVTSSCDYSPANF